MSTARSAFLLPMLAPHPRRFRRRWLRPAPICACLLLLWPPGGAEASSVSNEVGGQATQTTPSNPRAGDVADLFKANIDVTDALTFRAALGFTYEFATPAPTGGSFEGTSTAIVAVSVGLDWEVTEALTLAIDGVLSPTSAQSANADITLA
ncbi:MAG: hypothetical protein ACLPJH_14220, partial [Myxococcaceae bacterium]